MRGASRCHALAASIALFTLAPLRGQQRWIEDGADRGLPAAEATWLPYAADAEHPANRAFVLAWLVDLVPAEVAAALPREREGKPDPKEPGWRHFGKRAGEERDRRRFGGDGMQLPRESFSQQESAVMRAALDDLRDEALATARATPSLAAWLQSDLLRIARRLLDTGSNPELLKPLREAAHRLALPRATLRDPSLATLAMSDLANVDATLHQDRLIEIERRSTRLFDAEHSLLWSRVFLQWPDDAAKPLAEDLAAIARGERVAAPIGARAVLAQGIVALADDGAPCATPIAIDVRLQRYTGANTENARATTTQDGVDFRVFWLGRETVRVKAGRTSLADFRALRDDDQVLFRDYGTLKHTTVAAQCTLCHRATSTPEPELAGFPVLRAHARPTIASSASARMDLAERQFAKFLAELDAAAK